jgi:chemotaxis signal transduction protein
MTTATGGINERLAALRDAFDRSFGEPPRQQVADVQDLLAIRTAAGRYALCLTQTEGVFPDRPVMALPGPVPALLGLAGFRRSIVPAYDLGVLLGEAPSAEPRWLALVAGTPAVAVAFDVLDGHLRVPADRVIPASAGNQRGCLSGMVRLPDGQRPIVDLPAVRAAIQAMTP